MQRASFRRLWLATFALLAVAAAALFAFQPAEPLRGVVLISIDTLRADHLGCYGYDRNTTPTLDRLAAGGVLFEQATAPAAWTVPSHASLLTGLYPRSHGMKRPSSGLPEGVETLASLLARHGFATGAIINLVFLESLQEGFEDFTLVQPARGRYGAARRVHKRALRWLAKHRDGPFFLFLHHFDVHSDYLSRRRYERMFVEPYEGIATGETEQLKQARLGVLHLGPEDARHLASLYDAGIRQLDASLGSFLAAAGRDGLLKGVLVVVTSDHGEEFLEHGNFLHGRTLHQELVRVPLILWGEGMPAGRRVSQPVSLVDVAPTLALQLGVPAPAGSEGIDLSAYWRRWRFAPGSRPIFSEADFWFAKRGRNFRRALRRGRHALHYDARSDAYQLYDVRADPLEAVDIADRQPEVLARLRPELDHFMRGSEKRARRIQLSAEQVEELRRLGYAE